MNVLLLVRGDIFSIILLLFLIAYNFKCNKYRSEKNYFAPFALAGLGHVVFSLVTQITVNSTKISPSTNDACHILFFFFSLMYCLFFFRYILSLVLPSQKASRFFVPATAISTLAIIVMCFSEIKYLQGNGTKYSAGVGPTICYATGFMMFIFANSLLFAYRKGIAVSIILSILPISFLTVSLLVVQIIVPEFLFSGSALTLSSLGVFFAIENPVKTYEKRAYIDITSELYNRNRFEQDLKNINGNNERVAVLVCDLNGLSSINESFGHLVGDRFIFSAAKILSTELRSAWNIYRMDGDEFIVIYKNISQSAIEAEISRVNKACEKKSKGLESELSLSVGFAIKAFSDSLESAVNKADKAMYKNKKAYYALKNRLIKEDATEGQEF